jgi:rod shape-determining protein MreC
MEYSPPPLFKQGASARAKVVFFSVIAFGLLVADAHFHKLAAIRQVVGTALYPLQMVAVAPRDAVLRVGDYFSSVTDLKNQNRQMRAEQAQNAQRLQQAEHLLSENTHLRKLLGTSERLPVKTVLAELLYDARDAFTRKIVLDRGSHHGVALGQPVIDDIGVVGQVTRVFPFSSEVTLLTDKDQAIPVQVVRSGLRSVAYGSGQSGLLDLRFMATNADIQSGDVLVTSGIDGIYPPGLAVAKVARIESKSTDAFAHILCQPAAGVDRNRQLLILLAEAKAPPRPPPEEGRDHKEKGAKKKARDAAREAAAKENAKEAAKAAPATPGRTTAPKGAER